MAAWTPADIPPQTNKVAIVTGTGGLGYETALELARAGARVVLAGRNAAKGRESVDKVRTEVKDAQITFEDLDLASLASVADFAGRMAAAHPAIDLLINNAGVMAPAKRQTTADGFELQFGTNHLGHFALTAYLLPRLRAAAQPRVVNVASSVANAGMINFLDLQSERRYSPWRAYAQSKLANLLFTLELQRRSVGGAWGLTALAAHPGYARTELIANGPGANPLSDLLAPIAGQSPAAGALPTLMAVTAPDAKGGAYYGPTGVFGLKGAPDRAIIPLQGRDSASAKRLWTMSEALTGVKV